MTDTKPLIKLGLSQKITLGFMTVVALAVLIIGLVVIQLFHSYVLDSRQQSMESRARDIAAATSPYLSVEGIQPMRGYGAFIRFFDSLAGATVWITDQNGRTLIETKDFPLAIDEEKERLISQLYPTLQKGLSASEEIHPSEKSDVQMLVAVPVYDTDHSVIGGVFMVTPITGINSAIHQAMLILTIGLGGALILSFLLGWFFSRRLTKPLRLLSSSAREIAEGRLDVQTLIRQDDEIGQLGQAFDHMALRLKDSMDQLFLEKTKLSDVLDSISEGLLIYDDTGTLISANPAAQNLLSFSPATLREMCDPLAHDETLVGAVQAVLSGGPPETYIQDHPPHVHRYTVSPYANRSGEIAGAVVFVQDISESEHLEQMRRDFIANVSHELRTPLTMIRGAMEAIRDGAVIDPEAVSAFQNRIVDETLVLERLVNDLLDLSKLQSGKLALQVELLHPENLLQDALRVIAPLADSKQITIEMRFTPLPEGASVLGDYDRLRQILLVFLDNAVKYSPSGTKLILSIILTPDQSCLFEVADQGPGIPADDLPYIWDRFFRSDKSRSKAVQGTGLGLSIARLLVELHGGNVHINSLYGHGTTIGFSLPLHFESK